MATNDTSRPALGAGALLVSMLQLITNLCCDLDSTQKPHKIGVNLLQTALFGVDTNALSIATPKYPFGYVG